MDPAINKQGLTQFGLFVTVIDVTAVVTVFTDVATMRFRPYTLLDNIICYKIQ
jgi:hypothetical protein